MVRSVYQHKKLKELKKKALALYKQGWTTREIGRVVGKSHTWVADSVKGLDKTLQKR